MLQNTLNRYSPNPKNIARGLENIGIVLTGASQFPSCPLSLSRGLLWWAGGPENIVLYGPRSAVPGVSSSD